ncbi:acyloxyacyl hydrolase [Spirosoma pomorum]
MRKLLQRFILSPHSAQKNTLPPLSGSLGLLFLLLIGLPISRSQAQADSSRSSEFSVRLHYGLSVPNLGPATTGKVPLGIELNYSWLKLSQRSWEQCNCVAKAGVYANYYTFKSPDVLGRTAGAGLFFEPLIRPDKRLSFGVRAQMGLTYLNRLYDPVTNPYNDRFSMPISSMIGVSGQSYYRLTDRLTLNVSAHYNHISNAGTRLPNQGVNLPSLSAGLTYIPKRANFDQIESFTPAPLTKRAFLRALLVTSVRVLPKTTTEPEMALPLYGTKLVGGYRITRKHALSAGAEFIDDHYFKEQLNRWGAGALDNRQVTILAGYEFWQGRYTFTAHMGWNVVLPTGYKPTTYQKYGLLYQFPVGLTLGFDVKAYGDDTKGFQLMTGWTF